MTKGELIAEVAKKAGLTKAAAEKAVNAFIDTVKTALKKKDKVAIAGFGTFLVQKRKARTGINPLTKEKIKIPAQNVPKFKPGKELKEAVAGKKKK